MINICPCCTSQAVEITEKTAYCSHCLHYWRKGVRRITESNYYQSLDNRNNVKAESYQRKQLDRLTSISLIMKPNIKRVLEVGCAEGEFGAMVKNNFDVDYDGVEISKDAFSAEKKLDHVFKDGTHTIIDGAYDLILSFHVLEHIDDVSDEIKQWHRLMTETGTLIVEVPNKAGHALLENDNNPEHLHQFSFQSLSCLLGQAGFEVRSATTGHFESAVYNDCIRVVASKVLSEDQKKQKILTKFKQKLTTPYAVYGIGGDFQNYIYPYIQSLSISALLDSSETQWGKEVEGMRVQQYSVDQHGDLLILIASIRYGDDIIAHLKALGISDDRIITLDEIYDTET